MSAITESARGEQCTLRLPGLCRNETDTTVWAHGNSYADGKARGRKLPGFDHIGCYACYRCHMVFDGQYSRPPGMSRESVLARFELAKVICKAILKRKGLWPTEHEIEDRAMKTRARKNKSSKLVATNRSFLSRQLMKAVEDE